MFPQQAGSSQSVAMTFIVDQRPVWDSVISPTFIRRTKWFYVAVLPTMSGWLSTVVSELQILSPPSEWLENAVNVHSTPPFQLLLLHFAGKHVRFPPNVVACFIDSACRQHYRRGYLLFSTRLGRQTLFFVFNGISCDVSFRNACGKALWYECFREFTDPFYTTEKRWIFLLPISFFVAYN